jgi:uncharacterized caspase-like protein
VLRPLAALGFGLFAIGTLSIVAMLPDLWSKMHGPSAPSIVAPLPPIQAGPGTTDIRRETAAPVTLARPSAVPDAVASGGMRVALVIGNGGYRNVSRLPNPPRDADAVASSLRRAGFQTVMRQLDLTRERMNDVLREFAAVAEKADWAVIYFAGHGMEIGGTNYLIPIDAKLSFDRDVPFEAIPMDNVMSAVAGAKRLRLVLLDSCRDNPFVNQMSRTVAGRSIGRGLAQIEPEAGTLVVFAAKHGQIALDGERENSPFASALVKRVLTPGLEVRRLFDHVRDDVLELTGRRQQPFSYGSLPGREDFFFVARR